MISFRVLLFSYERSTLVRERLIYIHTRSALVVQRLWTAVRRAKDYARQTPTIQECRIGLDYTTQQAPSAQVDRLCLTLYRHICRGLHTTDRKRLY